MNNKKMTSFQFWRKAMEKKKNMLKSKFLIIGRDFTEKAGL